MPEIASFCGLRYSPARFGTDLSPLIAPPYDVLDEADKAELLRRSAANIVGVDLPHVPPKSAGPDELYAGAAERLGRWLTDGTLIGDQQPALYVYHQVYRHRKQSYTRRMFFARMRLEEFGKGTVFPHEKTFGGPKEDRLKLMWATACQLSAVFVLYSDPGKVVNAVLDMGGREPDVAARIDDVTNRMWVVTDKDLIQKVGELMARRCVYIADGHHRYGTALNYRAELTAKLGTLASDHPAQFVLVGLCAMEDPGALILPTHRVLSGFGEVDTGRVLAALLSGLKDVHQRTAPADADDILADDGPDDLAVFTSADGRVHCGRFAQREVLIGLAPEQSPAWRALDLAYLHRYLIDELVVGKALGGRQPTIQYLKQAAGALQAARDADGLALLCKPCTMAQVRAVSEAGDLMPQKSTYFYPKLATGLVLHPLA